MKTNIHTRLALVILAVLILSGSVGIIALYRNDIANLFLQSGNSHFGGSGVYNLKVAETYYRGALLLNPNIPDAWHQLARISFLAGDLDGALEKIHTQIRLHNEDLMSSYYIRGLIHGYRKEYPEAETDFSTFLLWDPKNWAAHNDLAWIYFSQGKFTASQKEAETALSFDPYNPWLHTMRGMSLFNLGKFTDAKETLLLAQRYAKELTEADWSKAYPGNDPRIAKEGLALMRQGIEENLELVIHKQTGDQ